MPIYEYTCAKCGHKVDVIQKVNEPAPERCEACQAQGTMNKSVSLTSFQLKGGGWFKDGYSSPIKKSDSQAGSDTSTSSKDSAKTTTQSDSKATSSSSESSKSK